MLTDSVIYNYLYTSIHWLPVYVEHSGKRRHQCSRKEKTMA